MLSILLYCPKNLSVKNPGPGVFEGLSLQFPGSPHDLIDSTGRLVGSRVQGPAGPRPLCVVMSYARQTGGFIELVMT